jgi:formate hydrogenlyase subunit 3/multisubunit Na+/H+ antiporter MnhD subunit
MSKQIRGLQSYQEEFSDAKRRERAYKLALEIRQFEIELYWKRATYFWTLLAATFAGYLALASSDKSATHPNLLFLVSCIGLVLSTSWYLVNRGSKYWQENWERHVDSLEDEFAGPLYKTTISNERFRWYKFWEGYPFSVSKVNQLTSLFVALVWLALAICSFPLRHLPACYAALEPFALAAVTAIFLILLVTLGKGRSQNKPRRVHFHKSDLD